ncbi:glycosyltransferase family A protein [Novipirellula artificiosorum]|nr:glycosyltransferase family 2 protein [Novipirellula artificiosorum]
MSIPNPGAIDRDARPTGAFSANLGSVGPPVIRRPRTSCLVNSYNYAPYVCEAVETAIEQELPFDEIIVVDDGSTDGSLQRLRGRFSSVDNVTIVSKPNGGQLSCFHEGKRLASGDLVFFLDADDRYDSRYNLHATDLYQRRSDVDFLSISFREIGLVRRRPLPAKPTRDYGISTLAAIFQRSWIGNPTSCLSMRSSLLSRVLPYPDEAAWRIRADDVLVIGSSIVGAHKFHLDQPLVDYRLHANNGFANQKQSPKSKMQQALQLNRLIRWYVEQMGYDISLLGYLLPREFRTLERPSLAEWMRYTKMGSTTNLPWSQRIGFALLMMDHYLRQRRRSKDDAKRVAADAEATVSADFNPRLPIPSDSGQKAA